MNRLAKSMRHIFWPHKKNQYKPLLIRLEGLAISLAALLIITGIANYQSNGDFGVLSYATNITIGDLLAETNQERTAVGLAPLKLDSKLNTAARNKASHMVANDYWSHVSPDGIPPWYFIDQVGYIYLKAGENLAYGFSTSSATVDGWMASPGHKANILDPDFKEVGFGILNGEDFQGDQNTVVVAMYTTPYDVPDVATVAVDNPDTTTKATKADEPREILTEESINEEEPAEETAEEPVFVIPGDLEVTTADGNPLDDPVLQSSITGRVITNFEALVTGKASPTLYITMFTVLSITAVYSLRHLAALKHYLVAGEHALEGHPLLEAGLLYGLIWLLLSATWGVIL